MVLRNLNNYQMSNIQKTATLTSQLLQDMYNYDVFEEQPLLFNVLEYEDCKVSKFTKAYYFAKSNTLSSDPEVLATWLATEFYQTDFAWVYYLIGFTGFVKDSEINGTYHQHYA